MIAGLTAAAVTGPTRDIKHRKVNTMRRNRRFVSALLAVCTAMTAFSCGSKKPADSSEVDHSDSTTTAAQTTAEAQQTATQGGSRTEHAQPVPSEAVRYTLSREGYELEQVVVLSRHNIRAPH